MKSNLNNHNVTLFWSRKKLYKFGKFTLVKNCDWIKDTTTGNTNDYCNIFHSKRKTTLDYCQLKHMQSEFITFSNPIKLPRGLI